jgi:uncharacterized repeat protein (TIGR03803 family)
LATKGIEATFLFRATNRAILPVLWRTPNPATNAFTTLFSFNGTDGARANASLVHAGNFLYGVASIGGGVNNDGVVYSYNLTTGVQSVLHSFSGADGAIPFCPLIDHGGKLYGTTESTLAAGTGVVFSVNHATGRETVLHSFGAPGDGALPSAGLLYSGGLLYGTTNDVGASGNGTVFSIDPSTKAETVVYSFTGGADGGNPAAGLISVGGMLYGTTSAGGTGMKGTVFQLDPTTQVETVIHAFNGTDGATPGGSLLYTGGMLYGTTTVGGTQNFGTVFSVTP